jgi:hypothetical protein
MDKLLDYNRQALFEKLRQVQVIDGTYKVNDIIDCLSSNKERDRRYVNKFEEDEIVIKNIKSKGYIRKVRFFTIRGIERYLNEGKVFSYKNACEFFKIAPRDLVEEKELDLLKTMYDSDIFQTKQILKWIFEKRKQIKKLGETCTIAELLEVLEEYDIDAHKLQLLKKFQTLTVDS